MRFSVVSAVYNVARYLPEFIESIEKQTFALDGIEVIAVDDGSDDASLVMIKEWAERKPGLVTVLSKENGGQGSARNLGLEYARGEWVTFADPDDILDPEYFATVDRFLHKHPATTMIATNRIFLIEQNGEIVNRHPLRHLFAGGDQIVDLTRFPDYFHGAGNAAFFDNRVLQRATLRFDTLIQPIFEDGHFCVRYLLAADAAIVGFVQSAVYVYRRRADGSSAVQTGLKNPGRYTIVPRRAYLDALHRGAEKTGRAPEWLQNMILYELSWFFRQDRAMSGAGTAARGDVATEFVGLLGEMAACFDADIIENFGVTRFDREWRDIMLHSFTGESWSTPYVVMQRYDDVRKQVRIAYRFVGDQPEETILRRGRPVVVRDGKVRTHEYFEHPLLKERIAWVPADGSLRVLLDGRPVEVRKTWPGRGATWVRPAQVASAFGFRSPARAQVQELRQDRMEKAKQTRLNANDWLIKRLASTKAVRRFFGDAWVLMDRMHEGDDNGERLFRYLRKRRRDVNAWFVIERGTPDWTRLKKDGYKRVIPHGTLRWKLLMLNCAHLISSQADLQIDHPPEIMRLTKQTWKFTFLQHGVIKDDLSRWLNGKQISLFITSTPQEHESIVADGTPYSFTTKEVKMTGMPRFDRLRELGNRVAPTDRDLVLVCPTWRHWLSAPASITTHRRVVVDDFFDSEYAQMWLGFLGDERLRDAIQAKGLRIAFLPHPYLQSVLPQMNLPSHVDAIPYGGQDIQALIARAAVMVTDLSSMAYNAAYIDRPVVYFHFDADQVLSGAHVGRRGYFDYARDGFGPVCPTIDDTVAAVAAVIDTPDRAPSAEYRRRIDSTFPVRDGQCSKRVVAAIENLDRVPGRKKPASQASG